MCRTQECVSICKSSDCSTKPSTNPFLLIHLENQTPPNLPGPLTSPSTPRFPSFACRAASWSRDRLTAGIKPRSGFHYPRLLPQGGTPQRTFTLRPALPSNGAGNMRGPEFIHLISELKADSFW